MRLLESRHLLKALSLTAAALVLTVPFAPAFGQEGDTPAAETQRPFVKGTLTGDNVNVRHGAGTQYPIYYKAPMGAEVKVVGREGQWLEVEFPARGFSWISAEYLSKVDEETGIVTGSEVNVRSGPGFQFDELYRVQANHKFNIVATDITGDWYRVAPMPDATAWIAADYVRLAGPVPGTAPAAPEPEPAPSEPTPAAPEAPAEDEGTPPPPGYYESKMTEAEEALKAQVEKEDPAEWDLEQVREMLTVVEAEADDAMLRVKARGMLAQLKGYESVKERAIEIGRVDEELSQRLSELEKQRQQKSGMAERATAAYLATGRLEKFYIEGLAGATHKLVDEDGSISYLLRSEVMELSPHQGKTCGVKGEITSAPGVKVQIIDVTNVAVLSGES